MPLSSGLRYDLQQALEADGHSKQAAQVLADGVMKRWAQGGGGVPAKVAALAAEGTRDIGTVTESSSAGLLLPKGPSPKQSKAITARVARGKWKDAFGDLGIPHPYKGSADRCSWCGLTKGSALHGAKGSGSRADISEHPQAVVPIAPGGPSAVRKRRMAKASFAQDVDTLEPQMRQAMSDLFDKQRSGTLSRLAGKRGKRMLSGNRADPPSADATGGGTPPSDARSPLDASAVFDPVFWADQTVKAAQDTYDKAGAFGADQVRGHLGPRLAEEAPGSIDATTDVLKARSNRMASDVTDTTFKAIQDQLTEGHNNGESISQLGDRVKHVFDIASTSRAQTIARTEVIGAMNEAANSYATALPAGIVGEKEWLAHHDARTRPDHRIADGQRRPLGVPFNVGGFPMQHPGDPTAPPDQVCNCRCSVAYIPAQRPNEVAL